MGDPWAALDAIWIVLNEFYEVLAGVFLTMTRLHLIGSTTPLPI